jgi:hypothetical protein
MGEVDFDNGVGPGARLSGALRFTSSAATDVRVPGGQRLFVSRFLPRDEHMLRSLSSGPCP